MRNDYYIHVRAHSLVSISCAETLLLWTTPYICVLNWTHRRRFVEGPLSLRRLGVNMSEIEKELLEVDGESFDEEVKHVSPPTADASRPKDPRSKAKYNIFSRLLFW